MAVAAVVVAASLGGCGVDLPDGSESGAGDGTAGRDVEIDIVPFVTTTAVIVTLVTRPGDDHLYAVQSNGQILRVDPPTLDDVVDGRLEPVAFDDVVLDIVDMTTSGGEEGLVGLAFDPSGEFAYVHHSRIEDAHSAIAEYRVDAAGRFDHDSRRELFVVEQSARAHNGGQLLFGPDGYLYLGFGDGSLFGDGSGEGDLDRVGLDLGSPRGKILRIDPRPAGDLPYGIPSDNPYVGVDGADARVWSSGLRNPYSFSFDASTGDLWIADVGQASYDEVNYAPAVEGRDAGKALSFGWSAFEGLERFNLDQSPENHTEPFVVIPHSEQGDCGAVIDGMAVRNSLVDDLDDFYVFFDWCNGTIRAIDLRDPTTPPQQIGTVDRITQLVQAENGNLYISALGRNGMLALVVPR